MDYFELLPNIQLRLDENDRNIQLKLDESDRNIQLRLDESDRNNQERFVELVEKIEKLENFLL